MSFHTETLVKKSKKRHFCYWCQLHIPLGESYLNIAGKDGDFYSYKAHKECQEISELLHYEGASCINDMMDECDDLDKLRKVKSLFDSIKTDDYIKHAKEMDCIQSKIKNLEA